MKSNQRLKCIGIGLVLIGGYLCAAHGQIVTPLAVGNDIPVKDGLGRPLPGDKDGDSNLASRVEIREVGAGIAAPDPDTGEGNDTANPLFLVTRIGQVVIGTNTGMFSSVLQNRLTEGVSYFARVYDASATGDANYYANSLPFEDVPPEQQQTVTTLDVVFQALSLVNQGDDTDSDGDLLPDWMEMDETSTDPNAWDTDEDGYNDGLEVLHGDYMDPTEKNPNEIQLYTPVFGVEPPPATNEYYVRWWSIPGVAYRLEYRDSMVDGQVFSNIWDGATSGTNLEISVDDWVQTNVSMRGFFRRWMVP